MSDPIRNPAHYTVYPVQPIEIARHLGFCMGNVVKYVLRAPFKGGVEDCNKALRYLRWEQEQNGTYIEEDSVDIGEILHPLVLYLQNLATPITGHQETFLRFLISYEDFGHRPSLKEMEKEVRRLKRVLEAQS